MGEPAREDAVFVGRGARVVEAKLLEEVAAWHAAVRKEPARLVRPMVIVVPSRSLRDHVATRLVREFGAVAGVSVQTHHTVALQILERAGEKPLRGAEWFPVLAQQAARAVPGLAALAELVDGYGAVTAAVSDLLDAGLDEATAPAVEDFFESSGRRDGPWLRAAAVAQTALGVRRELAGRGLGRMGDVLRQAREALEKSPESFPAARVLLHGYADATGLVTDLLRELVRQRPSLVLLDRPPDPLDPARPDLGVEFARRFEARVAPLAATLPGADGDGAAQTCQRSFFRAPGTDAEVRAVGRRLLALREQGAAWEDMAVVTRTPHLYASPLRVQFRRFGIPFSGVGLSGPLTPAGRRASLLVDLLRLAERFPVDRFVNALGGIDAVRRDDLRLGLHALGVARLGDLAALDAEEALRGAGRLPLPVRRGLGGGSAEAEGVEEASPEPDPRKEGSDRFAERRSLGVRTLEEGIRRAREVVTGLEDAAESAAFGEQLERAIALARKGLGWGKDEASREVVARLEDLGRTLPPEGALARAELALVIERAFQRNHEPLGGAGGGVQVLDVAEARGRTFGHLFVLGLNRDQFPRVVSDDPLLPDEVREPLQEILPELPVMKRGHDEERFLFAQLLSASADVTLSWQILGDDGKAKAPSPLVDRLLAPKQETELVPTAFVPEPESPEGGHSMRPAHEWALLAGLHASPKRQRELLAEAVDEAGGSRENAAARDRVRKEFEARTDPESLLGPYFGHVGPAREAKDLRHGALWVTTVEAIARCPWQAFLTRMLRLERPPDALEALPAASALLQGRLVHDVLERIAVEALGEDPRELEAATAQPVPWPSEERLRGWSVDAARKLLFEEGIAVPGYAALLAERILGFLDVARCTDWEDGPVGVACVEAVGSAEVPTPSGAKTLWFRADRVDGEPGGRIFTDYKTGNAKAGGVELKGAKPEKRAENLLKGVRMGSALQAAAYSEASPGARGRFLFLKPEVEDRSRVYEVGPGDDALKEAFRRAVGRVVAASDAGTFVPRLLDLKNGDEPATCEWCEVKIACARGDSGARRRLSEWSETGASGAGAQADALLGVWRMGFDDE